MTGIQALVRLPLDRKRLDRKLGLNTAGFISGYRGSPLGGYDQQLSRRQAAARRKRHPGLGGIERGSRRHGGLGLAAGSGVPGREIRWRVRHLVRQGAGRRPDRRRVQARQHGRHGSARRRAGAGGRRSQLQILDAALAIRIRADRRGNSGAGALNHPGRARLWPLRLGDEPLFGLLDRHDRPRRHDGFRRRRQCRRRSPRIVIPTDFIMPEGGVGLRIGDTPHGQGTAPARSEAACGAGLRAGQWPRPSASDLEESAPRRRSSWGRPHAMCSRRWPRSGSTKRRRANSAYRSSRSPCPGRWSRRRSPNSAAASSACW